MQIKNTILSVLLTAYLGLTGAAAMGCGPDDSTQLPNGDEIVSVDSGHPDLDAKVTGDSGPDGGLPDYGNITDTSYTDVQYVDAADGGTDVYPIDGGDNVSDTGYDGGGNLGPVVIIETKDDQGNLKDTFNVGEWVVYDLNKSNDPDCEQNNSCGDSKGLDYCERSDTAGNKGTIYFPTKGKGIFRIAYGSGQLGKDITFSATCYDRDNKSETIEETVVKIR